MTWENINRMCDKAAKGILPQCGRECGFTDHTVKKRATNLLLLPQKELEILVHNFVLFRLLV